MTEPDHWRRDARHPDRASPTGKARREMIQFALQITPRRRWIHRLRLRWQLTQTARRRQKTQ